MKDPPYPYPSIFIILFLRVFSAIGRFAAGHRSGRLAAQHRMQSFRVVLKSSRTDISRNYFLPSKRMRVVKARPWKALKVRKWGELMSAFTTAGLAWSVMFSKPPRSAQ